MKIDIDKLPEKSDCLSTRGEAKETIEKYGNPNRIEFRYKTSTYVSCSGLHWLRLPYGAILEAEIITG